MRFKIICDTFEEPELRSVYVTGLSYTVRPKDTKLAEFAKKWIEEGKAVELKSEGGEAQPAEISGVGTVT